MNFDGRVNGKHLYVINGCLCLVSTGVLDGVAVGVGCIDGKPECFKGSREFVVGELEMELIAGRLSGRIGYRFVEVGR